MFPSHDQEGLIDNQDENKISILSCGNELARIAELQAKDSEKKELDKRGYIYILTRGGRSSHYKIGRSKNPEKRLAEYLRIPGVEIVGKYFNEDSYAEEARLHRLYSERRVSGEWFKLTKAIVQNILKECK